MNIAILGYGDQGRAAREYWSAPEYSITICDLDESLALPDDVQLRLGPDYLQNLNDFDLIVRSPSIHPRDIVAANGPDTLAKVTSVTNEFLRVCPTKNVVGVTGTKGKGTTSTMIARMLEANGKRVHLGGNIGIPPLDLLKNNIQPDDWVVLELANFQLIDLHYSPHIAVCLMVVPEHMNWHTDFAEYVASKSQLFTHQTADDIAIYFAENAVSEQIAHGGLAQKIRFYAPPGAYVDDGRIVMDGQSICRVDELRLLGKHNWQNACAAVTAVWQISQDVAALRTVLTSFSGLEHRLELISEVDGVKYYDDSFGTAPTTAIVAIKAFDAPKIVILGGSEKEANYDELAQTVVASNVRTVILIGQTAPKIKAALSAAGYTSTVDGGHDMTSIVATARGVARPGDIVLLSTACASFDMFKNYKDRGEQFKNTVNSLR